MKWEDVYWENTHFCAVDLDGNPLDIVHIGMKEKDSGERLLVLRFGSDGDGPDDKSFTILMDQDQAEDFIAAVKTSTRSL